MKNQGVEAILSIGSNIGDSKANLNRSCQYLERDCGSIIRLSSFYESEAWGFQADQKFLNAVVVLQTQLPPMQLLEKLKGIEVEMGRDIQKRDGYASRIIDIDIIDYNQEVFKSDSLTIPHVYMKERCFVLQPLIEVCPDYKHPTNKGFDITQALENLGCASGLKKIPNR